MTRSRYCLAFSLLSFLTPLALIGAAAAFSGWFNIYTNALSDLGHATRSRVAPLFNLGLSLGGFIIIVYSALWLRRISPLFSALTAITGYAMTLVAVFDEVYGRLHFYVSVALFLCMATLLLYYAARLATSASKRASAILALALAVSVWVLHLTARVPPGAAIPELVSVAALIPFHVEVALRMACRQ